MPRADKMKKSVAKELAAAVALPGQSRIFSIYFKASRREADNDKSEQGGTDSDSFIIMEKSS